MPPAQTPSTASTASTRNTPSTLYRNYVLFMLTIVYVFNFIDRQVLVILQESIKKDLHLSDAQLGFLSGFTFAIFYAVLGVPIARLADRTNRRNTITLSLGLWSIMTAVSGTARNFIQLAAARIGVGIGEAGGSPPAHAMISDYFPPCRRSTALSIYSTGIYFGTLIGYIMGGYLNQRLGWRTAFFAVGAPGIFFSLLFYATVKEPRRGSTDTASLPLSDTASLPLSGTAALPSTGTSPLPPTETHTFREVLKLLYSKKTFIFLTIATSLLVFCIYGLLNWAPSFLGRIHGMTPAERGRALGLALGIGGAIGSFAGGALTDRFGKKDRQWYLKIPAYAILLSIGFAIGALYLKSNILSVVCFGCTAALQSMYLGPSVAVAHSLVPASMRALTSAVLFLALNFIGLGFGPWIVGMISDRLTPSLGVEALRWAMSIVLVVSLVSAMLFFRTAKTLAPSRP
ncbi:MAG TPA: MFS transporter [Puia sp.]|jgi:predicted MFS family arabinose efflux permease|nr:MFS transporter [Puia sp.]